MFSVTLENASLSFDGEPVFESLTLTLPAEQWTCLLGASGCGKTSLLRMLAGLLTSSNSNARIYCSDGSSLNGRIAWMAQQDLLLPWLKVIDNACLGERLRTGHISPNKKQQAVELLTDVGLGNHLHTLPSELSGGQRQRAALVRTLLENKPVVLMDEPFAALDAISRLQLQQLAAKLLKGKTVLLVTHDPMEALRLGHQIMVLSGQPASINSPFCLTGTPPRSLDDAPLTHLQSELLSQLGAWE